MKLKSVLIGLAASSLLAACGGPRAPMQANFAPGMNPINPMFAANVPGLRSFSVPAAQNELFSTFFVPAYHETIAENEPIARQDPNSPAASLVRQIQSARQTVDGAFYDIDDPGIVQAFIQAKQRGVRVRIVTDTDNMVPKGEDARAGGPLRESIAQLQQAGIPVVDDQRSGIMHDKFLITDNQSVWTGSTNITSTSLYNHNNNAIIINNREIAENYLSEFERMFTNRIFGPRPARQVPHPVVKVGNTTIRTFFSPKGGGKEAIMDVLSHTQKRISFMTFSFTDSDIANLMVQKKNAGVQVDGVFDQCLGYGRYSMYHVMRQNNIYTRMDGNEALLHHKVILADDTVITGSYNFSSNADKTNDENMLIIENNSYVAASYYQEYDRIMNAAKVNHPPQNKCPGQDN